LGVYIIVLTTKLVILKNHPKVVNMKVEMQLTGQEKRSNVLINSMKLFNLYG